LWSLRITGQLREDEGDYRLSALSIKRALNGTASGVSKMTRVNDVLKVRIEVGANTYSGNIVDYNLRIKRQAIDLREVKGMRRYYPDRYYKIYMKDAGPIDAKKLKGFIEVEDATFSDPVKIKGKNIDRLWTL
jgi:hypothetical protein